MNTLFAIISGGAVIHGLLYLIICAVIFWLLNWLIAYIGIPEPFAKVIKVVMAIAVVIVLINFLLGLAGEPFIQW